jgi:hypothetical protein
LDSRVPRSILAEMGQVASVDSGNRSARSSLAIDSGSRISRFLSGQRTAGSRHINDCRHKVYRFRSAGSSRRSKCSSQPPRAGSGESRSGASPSTTGQPRAHLSFTLGVPKRQHAQARLRTCSKTRTLQQDDHVIRVLFNRCVGAKGHPPTQAPSGLDINASDSRRSADGT